MSTSGELNGSRLERRYALRTSQIERYRRMLEIRELEDRIQRLFFDGHVDGTTHTCQGQEAVAVGVAAALEPTDVVTCTYRGHGHALALGLPPEVLLGEILGRTTGCIRGMGGSMHLSDPEIGLLPTFAIVGAGIPVAVGAGLSAQVRGTSQVGVAIFGDGAANIGAFHEGLNLASIWKLPTVFVIENNHYGEYSRIDKTTPIENLADRASSYGIPGQVVDGQDVTAVEEAMLQSVQRARAGEGPTLLEMKTYRFAGHSRSDKAAYRPAGELERWKQRDPVILMHDRLVASGEATHEDLESMRADMREQIEACVNHALEMPRPTINDMFLNVLADPVAPGS